MFHVEHSFQNIERRVFEKDFHIRRPESIQNTGELLPSTRSPQVHEFFTSE